MSGESTPAKVPNLIDGAERDPLDGGWVEKRSPATGEVISTLARSDAADVDLAVAAARAAQPAWAARTVPERGRLLRELAKALEDQTSRLADLVAAETGKAPGEAAGEVGAAIEQAYFVAGEGRRFYGRTTTSAVLGRQAYTVRQPLGVAGLIIAANTPIANVAWKLFPALLCGNGVVLKAAEDTPQTALEVFRLAVELGFEPGVLNLVQGLGAEAGAALVAHPDVDVVSFTGSTRVGSEIARVAGERLAKVCLELGGKNPMIICDDADLDRAAQAAAASAYSNAGQRCAAGTRFLIFESVYDEFLERFVSLTEAQKVGPGDEHDLGPVINERQLEAMVAALARAAEAGGRILAGGSRLDGPQHAAGYYMQPTIVADLDLGSELATTELFGPICTVHRVSGFEDALEAAGRNPYGLTASIWTNSVHRGQEFIARIGSGVAAVNGPTYGSEPHMPFGGLGRSGNGWREAGTEALDVYSDLKTVYVNHWHEQD